MKNMVRLSLASALSLSSFALLGQTNVLMQHNDIGRTGLNPTETVLTPANVSSGAFGKLYSVALDGQAFTQPLYVSSVTINGSAHSVAFLGTTHDSVYALDANANGSILWKASLLDSAHGAAAGAIPDPQSDTGCGDIDGPEYGIMGTPVIDASSGTLYVVSLTLEGASNPYPVQRLHALDISSGAEKFGGPIQIQASVAGTGSGSSNGQLAFDAKWNNQRPGLLFINNTVYIGWGSHCDEGPWHGWLLGYSAGSGKLQQTSVFVSTPNGGGSGIWLSGTGLAADNINGNPRLFTAAGNGNFDGTGEWGESVLDFNLSKGLAIQDSFTPGIQSSLTSGDIDLASAGPILLPDQPGSHPHLAVELSKAGWMYLLNRDNLGGYNTTSDQVLQEQTFGPYPYGIWGAPAYFNSNIYFWPANSNMMQYGITNGVLSGAPTAKNSFSATGQGGGYYFGTFQGATPSVSANGTSNGIVWAVDTVRDQGNPIEYFYAFDATNVAKTLWSTLQNPVRDGPGAAQKYAVPTISDGKVFVAGGNHLNVYGLLPPGFSLAALPAALTVIAGTSSSTQITIQPIAGFTGAVSLAASGLPAGVTALFSPVTSGVSTLTLTAASGATPASGTMTVTGISGSITQTFSLPLSVAATVQPVPVNFSSLYGIYSSFTNNTAPLLGGLDSAGYAYSANLLGTSLSALGVSFQLGPANLPNAVTSIPIPLTPGSYKALNFLATGVNGGQANQQFVVSYTDGTTQAFTQSLSDWGHPANYTGETVAASMAYRILPSGGTDNNTYNLYAYSFALNPAKTVQSFGLPANSDVIVLAVTLSGEVIQSTTTTQPTPNNSQGFSLPSGTTVYATANDGSVPPSGGLDGAGYAYSATLVGSSVVWSNTNFPIGAAGSKNGASNATLTLPSGTYTSLKLLATGVFGNQTNQSFVVTYTDGTTSKYQLSLSDWGTPQGFPGESNALSMAYRVAPNGSKQSGPWYLYGYSLALNSSKTVKSLTLPATRNVIVVGMALTGPVVNLASVANITASANSGTAPAKGGFDGESYAYASGLLGTSLTWGGDVFSFGAAGTPTAVSAGTVALPAGQYSSLNLLAAGANGSQSGQQLVIKYSDGSTTTFTQNVSDWGYPQGFSGESTALQMTYRILPSGATQNGPWYVYGYSFALNNSKTVSSITLPNNRNVVVLGMALNN